MKILIKYATRGRREMFINRMKNIQQTISKNANYTIIVSIDNDDHTMRGLPGFSNTYICVGRSNNKIEAINANMDIITDWDLLINFSDDMEFVVSDWDLEMQKHYTPDCFLHFNDGYVGDKLPTMSIMDKVYYNRFGYIYHPSYKTESCDAEAMYVAQMLGKHKYIDTILFKHKHPCNTGGCTDDTYKRNGVFAKDDHRNYFERMKNYFDIPADQRTCLPFEKHIK